MRRSLLLCLGLVACKGGSSKPGHTRGPETGSGETMTSIASAAAPAKPAYPPTRRDDIVDEIHGTKVADPYRWVEDATRPDVQAWMKAQDDFTRARLDALPGRDALAARLREVFYYDALSAPVHYRGRYFWTRKHKDKEKTVVYWKQGEAGAEQVLFDPNTWSDDGSIALGGWWPSWDGTHVAYAVKENNSDEAVMYVVEVATGKKAVDAIAGAKYAVASWTPDGKGFYYTWVPPISKAVPVADRPGFAELRYHALGTDPAHDRVVHERTGDAQTFLGGFVSKDGRWLFTVIQHGWNSTDVYVKDLAKKGGNGWTPLVVGVDAIFDVTPWRDQFYVFTNDGAPRYRVYKVDPARLDRKDWREIVAQSDDTLEHIGIVGEHLVLTYLRHAASAIEIRTLDGAPVRTVALPPLGTAGGVVGQPDEDTGYVSYTSFTEPSLILKTSIATGAVEQYARVTLPIDTAKFVAEQVRYPSKDGTSITMFLLRNKDTAKTGKNPTILYGYGGFNVSMTPAFASSWAVWLERGGMVAIPNLRGGGEYGEDWHKDGMLLKKQNVFDDYVAAARYLIAEGWTSPARLAVSGGSNGGLLVGAAMTQAPELFRAVICAVPLLDMVRYHLFGSGKTWVPEYGSADDAEQFGVLYGYSPYHHVEGGVAYPALLMLAADSDDRVDPMHARKFTAAVQHATSSSAPALLRIERNAGHGGADLVKQKVEQTADTYAFLIEQLAM